MIGKREEREEVSNPTPSPTVGLMFPPQFDPLSCPTTCACFLCEPVLPLALMHKESKKRGKDSPKRPLVLKCACFRSHCFSRVRYPVPPFLSSKRGRVERGVP